MKEFRYAIEAALLCVLFLVFRLMPLDAASRAGGWLGRTIGPKLAATRKARRNLESALPGLGEAEYTRIITGMWENLGRVAAEYPHIATIARERITAQGREILQRAVDAEKSAVLFGAHLANWEIGSAFVLTQFGQPMDLTYRAPNNPWTDWLILKARTLGGRLRAHPKSRATGKALIEAIKNRRFLGVLLDQKYNEGIPVPFFGREAMTNPVFVQLCQKYGCPLIPVQCRRTNGAQFELTIYPEISLFDDDGTPRLSHDVMADVNDMMEQWIRQTPEQWLWLHRRWDSQRLAN